MTRFALDEDKAARWIAQGVARFDQWAAGETDAPPELEISSDYCPSSDFESGTDTFNLVASARDESIITGPGEIDFDFRSDADGVGYMWLVYLGDPGHSFKLAGSHESLRHLGDRGESQGADAAMAVLREAVSAGNLLLDHLAAYVAQHQATDQLSGLLADTDETVDQAAARHDDEMFGAADAEPEWATPGM